MPALQAWTDPEVEKSARRRSPATGTVRFDGRSYSVPFAWAHQARSSRRGEPGTELKDVRPPGD